MNELELERCECNYSECIHNATRTATQLFWCWADATDTVEYARSGRRYRFCPECAEDAVESRVYERVHEDDEKEG